jgi:Zn-dependent M28 family amino/carboxypeptidase
MATVRTLASDDYQGRAAGSAGGAKARALIVERFAALGLKPIGTSFEHPFEFTPKPASTPARREPASPLRGVNVVARCPGTEPGLPAIVVSAHYDHLGIRDGRIYHGADDNASGVAVLLELAAQCTAQPFRHDLVFAAFDAEEEGLQGAAAFLAAPTLPRSRIELNVNLDMVARGDKGELYVSGLQHNPALRPLLQPVAARAPIQVRFGHDIPGTGSEDWTMQSDHGPFHRAGIPFVYFGVEDHPDYHQPTDTADKINPDFFVKAAGVVLDALRTLDEGLRA